MTVEQAYESLAQDGFATFPSAWYQERLSRRGSLDRLPALLSSFARLVPDQHMGDGGTYRNRAYSRFLLQVQGEALELVPLEGHSIFQTLEDNSLNGGVLRTYAPLAPEVAECELLKALILEDALHALACDPGLGSGPIQVGVHQVRIVARSGVPGLPTPEGVHRDSERFTFQHFCDRSNITGGEFRAYNSSKELQFQWLQTDCLDTVMFEGTTWHSATPVACADLSQQGHRDIFLVDFDQIKEPG